MMKHSSTGGAGQSLACSTARTGASLTQGFFSRTRIFGDAALCWAVAGFDCAVQVQATAAQLTARSVPLGTRAMRIPLHVDHRLPGPRKFRFILRARLAPRGGVSNFGAMRPRTGRLAMRIFSRNSRFFF
ncbi:MAG: hypothetical protein JWN34_3626 [Bryobacterales bacterium]|nr:hypothetical protein [Bryobacterales bacterium]